MVVSLHIILKCLMALIRLWTGLGQSLVWLLRPHWILIVKVPSPVQILMLTVMLLQCGSCCTLFFASRVKLVFDHLYITLSSFFCLFTPGYDPFFHLFCVCQLLVVNNLLWCAWECILLVQWLCILRHRHTRKWRILSDLPPWPVLQSYPLYSPMHYGHYHSINQNDTLFH